MAGLQVAVLDTGMMGPGIVAGLALAGHAVALYGRTAASLERGFATVDGMLSTLTDGGVISRSDAGEARARMRMRGTTDLRDAVAPGSAVPSAP